MAFSPITSWQVEGEKVETVTDFIFLDSKITVDSDCSHEIKRRLLLRRKAMINLDNVLKSRHTHTHTHTHTQSRDITLPTVVHIVKTLVFP